MPSLGLRMLFCLVLFVSYENSRSVHVIPSWITGKCVYGFIITDDHRENFRRLHPNVVHGQLLQSLLPLLQSPKQDVRLLLLRSITKANGTYVLSMLTATFSTLRRWISGAQTSSWLHYARRLEQVKMKYPSGIRAISLEYVDSCERTWLLLTFNSLSSSAQVHIASTLRLP